MRIMAGKVVYRTIVVVAVVVGIVIIVAVIKTEVLMDIDRSVTVVVAYLIIA